jgi:hypothetical protein
LKTGDNAGPSDSTKNLDPLESGEGVDNPLPRSEFLKGKLWMCVKIVPQSG